MEEREVANKQDVNKDEFHYQILRSISTKRSFALPSSIISYTDLFKFRNDDRDRP